MPNVETLLRDHVTLNVDCIDRLYLNGYVPLLQRPENLWWFLHEHRKHPVIPPVLLQKITEGFVGSIHAFAAVQDSHPIRRAPWDGRPRAGAPQRRRCCLQGCDGDGDVAIAPNWIAYEMALLVLFLAWIRCRGSRMSKAALEAFDAVLTIVISSCWGMLGWGPDANYPVSLAMPLTHTLILRSVVVPRLLPAHAVDQQRLRGTHRLHHRDAQRVRAWRTLRRRARLSGHLLVLRGRGDRRPEFENRLWPA